MENKKVMLINMVNRRVGIDVPDLRLSRVWERKGAKKPIDLDVLKEAFYDPGVEYLLREGILYIEDMDVKIELGLEEDASSPTIIILNEDELKRYLTVMPIFEFREKVNELGREQKLSLVDYAIENEHTNYEKCEILKELVEVDIIRAIQLKRDAERD